MSSASVIAEHPSSSKRQPLSCPQFNFNVSLSNAVYTSTLGVVKTISTLGNGIA
jgi:hypothetical protein